MERNLNLQGHQRVVVEHVKGGRQHHHVIWNRVDVETLRVIDIKGNYAAHLWTARELEQMFGLEPTTSPRRDRTNGDEPLWERQAGEAFSPIPDIARRASRPRSIARFKGHDAPDAYTGGERNGSRDGDRTAGKKRDHGTLAPGAVVEKEAPGG